MRLPAWQIKKRQCLEAFKKVIFNPVYVSELCYYYGLLEGEKGRTERLHPFRFPNSLSYDDVGMYFVLAYDSLCFPSRAGQQKPEHLTQGMP